MNRINVFDNKISPNQRRLRFQELSGIPLNENQKKKLKPRTENVVSMVEPTKYHNRLSPTTHLKNTFGTKKSFDDLEDDEELDLQELIDELEDELEDEVDLDEILKEMGYVEDEEEEFETYENMSDIPELTDDEIDSILSDLEDDSVNEINFDSKGYKEGRKLVDKLRRELFRKLNNKELDDFMGVLQNSFGFK